MTVQREIRQVLAELEMVSHTQAANLEPSAKNAEHENAGPPKVSAPHLYWRWRFENCKSDGQRRSVIQSARAELRHIKRGRLPRVDLQTREGRLTLGKEALRRSVGEVADEYELPVSTVYRYRAEARKVEQMYESAA